MLGDRTSHELCLNFPQIFYCVFVLFLLSLPSHVFAANTLDLLSIPTFLALSFLHFMALRYFTTLHPYHGHQSRHMTSYVLRFCFTGKRRYAWIPLYVFAEHCVAANLHTKFGFLETVLFIFCTALTIAPSSLVEPRYYIIPAAIYLKSLDLSRQQYLLTIASFTLTNLVLLGLLILPIHFGRKPIIW